MKKLFLLLAVLFAFVIPASASAAAPPPAMVTAWSMGKYLQVVDYLATVPPWYITSWTHSCSNSNSQTPARFPCTYTFKYTDSPSSPQYVETGNVVVLNSTSVMGPGPDPDGTYVTNTYPSHAQARAYVDPFCSNPGHRSVNGDYRASAGAQLWHYSTVKNSWCGPWP